MNTPEIPFFMPPPSRWSTFVNAHRESDQHDLKKDAFAANFKSPKMETLDQAMKDLQEAAFPEAHALDQLKQRGIEAFRPRRKMTISGGSVSPDDVIYLWPSTPVEGFALVRELRDIAPHDVEKFSDGSVRILTPLVFSGRRYKADAIIEPWPERPLPGFITARKALAALIEGILEPAPLESPE